MGDNKKKIIIAAIVIVLVIVAIVGGVFTVMKSNRSANTNNTTIPNSAYVENTNIKNGNGNQVSTTTNISDNANVNENNNQNANQNANQNTATTWDDVNENTNVNTNTNGSKPVHDDMLGQDFDNDLCADTAKRAVEAFNTYNAGLLNNGDYLNAITPLIDYSVRLSEKHTIRTFLTEGFIIHENHDGRDSVEAHPAFFAPCAGGVSSSAAL